MGVSKNSDTSKWMVYSGSRPYEQMDGLGGFPIFLETPICLLTVKWIVNIVRGYTLPDLRNRGKKFPFGLSFMVSLQRRSLLKYVKIRGTWRIIPRLVSS